eukprot:Nitzschia sp. Nitz4//scaffold32_size149145//19447//26119//NITZ4_002866-RA/size149145-augustus-gene-0.25-mRNA-1//1//CDS//3329548030//795//frame0
MATLTAIGVNFMGSMGVFTATLVAFGAAIRSQNTFVAARCTARPPTVIYNPDPNRDPSQDRGNPAIGWVPWVMKLTYGTMLSGVPGTGTRDGGLSGALLKVNLDGIVLLRFHHLCLRVTTLAAFLYLVVVLPLYCTAKCANLSDEFFDTVECQEANLTDYQRLTLASVPRLQPRDVSTLWEVIQDWFLPNHDGDMARLYAVVLCGWIICSYALRELQVEWGDVLAMRRVYYLEADHWADRSEELACTLLREEREKSQRETETQQHQHTETTESESEDNSYVKDRSPWVPHPEQRDTVPNIELYSVLVGGLPRLPMEAIDTDAEAYFTRKQSIDWQLSVTTAFFDHCVPNQPGFSSSVAAVTILPSAQHLTEAWNQWYRAAGKLRQLRFIRKQIAICRKKARLGERYQESAKREEEEHDLEMCVAPNQEPGQSIYAHSKEKKKYYQEVLGTTDDLDLESKLLFALDFGPEQTATYSREFALGAANLAPYGWREQKVRTASLNELYIMEQEAMEEVRLANAALREAQERIAEDSEDGSDEDVADAELHALMRSASSGPNIDGDNAAGGAKTLDEVLGTPPTKDGSRHSRSTLNRSLGRASTSGHSKKTSSDDGSSSEEVSLFDTSYKMDLSGENSNSEQGSGVGKVKDNLSDTRSDSDRWTHSLSTTARTTSSTSGHASDSKLQVSTVSGISSGIAEGISGLTAMPGKLTDMGVTMGMSVMKMTGLVSQKSTGSADGKAPKRRQNVGSAQLPSHLGLEAGLWMESKKLKSQSSRVSNRSTRGASHRRRRSGGGISVGSLRSMSRTHSMGTPSRTVSSTASDIDLNSDMESPITPQSARSLRRRLGDSLVPGEYEGPARPRTRSADNIEFLADDFESPTKSSESEDEGAGYSSNPELERGSRISSVLMGQQPNAINPAFRGAHRSASMGHGLPSLPFATPRQMPFVHNPAWNLGGGVSVSANTSRVSSAESSPSLGKPLVALNPAWRSGSTYGDDEGDQLGLPVANPGSRTGSIGSISNGSITPKGDRPLKLSTNPAWRSGNEQSRAISPNPAGGPAPYMINPAWRSGNGSTGSLSAGSSLPDSGVNPAWRSNTSADHATSNEEPSAFTNAAWRSGGAISLAQTGENTSQTRKDTRHMSLSSSLSHDGRSHHSAASGAVSPATLSGNHEVWNVESTQFPKVTGVVDITGVDVKVTDPMGESDEETGERTKTQPIWKRLEQDNERKSRLRQRLQRMNSGDTTSTPGEDNRSHVDPLERLNMLYGDDAEGASSPHSSNLRPPQPDMDKPQFVDSLQGAAHFDSLEQLSRMHRDALINPPTLDGDPTQSHNFPSNEVQNAPTATVSPVRHRGLQMTKQNQRSARIQHGDDDSVNSHAIAQAATAFGNKGQLDDIRESACNPEGNIWIALEFEEKAGLRRRESVVAKGVTQEKPEPVDKWTQVTAIVQESSRNKEALHETRERMISSGVWYIPTLSGIVRSIKKGISSSYARYKLRLKPPEIVDDLVRDLVTDSSYAVVTFTSRQAAVAARHCLTDSRGQGRWVTEGDMPIPPLADAPAFFTSGFRGCVRPVTLSISDKQKIIRHTLAMGALVCIYFFYTIPLTAAQELVSPESLSKIFPDIERLQQSSDFLANIFSGFIPALVWTSFFAACPPMFKIIANFGSNATSSVSAENSALQYFWWFMLVSAFTGTSFATAFVNGLRSGLNLGSEIRKVIERTAIDIPTKVSATWLNWMIIRVFAVLPTQYLLQMNSFLFTCLGLKCCARAVRGGGAGGPVPYRIYVDSGVVMFCVFALAPASPLIAAAAFCYFFFCTPLLRWTLIFLYKPKFDIGGGRFPIIFDICVSGMVVGQVLLVSMMTLKRAVGPAVGAFLPMIPTIWFRYFVRRRYLRAFNDAALLQTSLLDGWDTNAETSEKKREEFRRFLVDCHKAAYVPVCIAGDKTAMITAEPAVVIPLEVDDDLESMYDESENYSVSHREEAPSVGQDQVAARAQHQFGAMIRRASVVQPPAGQVGATMRRASATMPRGVTLPNYGSPTLKSPRRTIGQKMQMMSPHQAGHTIPPMPPMSPL